MSFYTLLTTIGAARLANAQATSTTVDLVELAVGDGEAGAAYNPTEAQTELKNEVWRGDINQIYVHAENANWIVIEAVVPEEVGGWFVREVGIFDGDDNMIAVGKYPETYKPELAEGSAKDLYIRMILQISNTGDVELKIDPAIVLATRKYADDKMIAHLAAVDPHTQYAVPDATTEIKGKVELATVAEAKAGTDTARAVTPAGLGAALDGLRKRDLLERLLSAIGDSSTNPSLGMDPETYEDTSKIDGGLSTGYVHDAEGDFIHNPGIVITPSASGEWNGATPSVTFDEDDFTIAAGDKAIRTNDTLTGDFSFKFTVGSSGYHNVGVHETDEDDTFNAASQSGGMFSMTASYWWERNLTKLRYGSTEVAAPTWADGTEIEFRRTGAVVEVYADEVLYHTYTQETEEPMRIVAAAPSGAVYTNVSWTVPGGAENFTIVSTPFEAWAEPTKGFWGGFVEPIDAITYSTDYLVDLSKDDGGTWEPVTVSKIGEVVIDVAGVPTTVDFVYGELTFAVSGDKTIRTRVRGVNDKESKSHGAIREVE